MEGIAQRIEEIEISKLVPHPRNANVMSAAVMAKVRRHIEKTGRYEPLVVRRHPSRAGFYELINGHHRKEILESLGHARAACVVWELDDAETLMLLATVNRLGGEDAPGKRLALLEAMAAEMEVAEMAKWVPEDAAMLSALLKKQEAPALVAEAPPMGEMMEAFTVFLKHEEKERLVKALKAEGKDVAGVLMRWVEERGGGKTI
ncbi:MAG: ParB N-terminal domain-containing protein [Phycisphaerae bacterium]